MILVVYQDGRHFSAKFYFHSKKTISLDQWRIQDGIPRGANRGRGFGAPGQIEEWRPSAEVLDGGRGSMLEVIISFSDNVIGIRLLKIALTLNWLVLNVRASSTRKFEMLSEKWGAHYSVNFMNNFGLLVWVPINRYYWVILGIIVKNVFKKIFKINVKRVYCCILKW